jgi:hypothetical protein
MADYMVKSLLQTNNCDHSTYAGKGATVHGAEEDPELKGFKQTYQSFHWYFC